MKQEVLKLNIFQTKKERANKRLEQNELIVSHYYQRSSPLNESFPLRFSFIRTLRKSCP